MSRPLAGRRVVVTRAPHQAGELSDLLAARGAEPVCYPCIDIALPADPAPLDAALRQAAAAGFDWLVFTSRNVAAMLDRRLAALDIDPSALRALSTAAVGPSTADTVREALGLSVDLVPDEYVAEALAEALIDAGAERVLLPQSNLARPALGDALTAAGVQVTAVDAYRTVIGSGGADLPALLRDGDIDALTFTSSSTVDNFMTRLTAAGVDRALLGGVTLACIGPVTAGTLEAHGLPASVIPDDYTLAGLLDALEDYYR